MNMRRQFDLRFYGLSRQQEPVKIRAEMGPQGSIYCFVFRSEISARHAGVQLHLFALAWRTPSPRAIEPVQEAMKTSAGPQTIT